MLITSLIAALAAPATVLDHTLDVRLDYGRRLSSTQTWTVRIDEPEACVAGLLTPPGLDGAVDGGAMVLENLLIIPGDAVAGDVFTLTSSSRGPRGRHSGVFETAPDLPVKAAKVTVTALGSQPLTVWADPLGDPIWSTRGGKKTIVTWDDLESGQAASVVWSTWSDWLEAGEALASTVDGKLATKRELGRDLAGDLDASNLPEIVRRTFQHVAIDLGATGGFDEARAAALVAQDRKGTPAERALVLLSMLRAAGYTAQPARVRKTTAKGLFPVTVPSPDMLDTPMVQARDRKGRTLWIDPASDSVAVPGIPAAMVGATAWVPGDLPSRRIAPGVVDGNVVITTSATIDLNGNVTWSADVNADGTGLEAVRTLLRSLDNAGQEQALRRLVKQGRPELERFAAQTSGTVDPFKTFSVRLSGYDSGTFTPEASGLRGTIVPVLGSAMAAWLPPNIRVQEIVDVKPPTSFTVAAHTRPGPAYAPAAQLDREVVRNGARVRIDVDAIRPYAASTSAMEAAAASFFGETALQGVELLLFPPASKAVVKGVQQLEHTPAEKAALQALLWWSVEQDKSARKVLKKAMKTMTAAELLVPLREWVAPDDQRPWRALIELIAPEDRAAQLALIESLERVDPALALDLAGPLMQHSDANVAGRALLVAIAHAPSQEVRNSLATRAKLVEPELKQAITLAVAEYDIDQGQDAASITADLAETSVRSRMVKLAGVAAALPKRTLLAEVLDLRASAPNDAAVASRGAQLLARAGFTTEALATSLDAARLAHDDPALWADVGRMAAQAGNLQLAEEAAVRASELAPTNAQRSAELYHVALLTRNNTLVELARKRDASLPAAETSTLDELTAIASQNELLALLQFHDEEVGASPIHLALRAQLRTDAGFKDDAARDGINLARVHGDPQGRALAFAATAGRVFGTGAVSLLDDVSDPTARLTRLDYRLITGSGDARSDAQALRDEPRAQDVLLAIGDPAAAAAKVEGWPTDLKNVRGTTPKGYRVNPVLSAAKGVNAYSHADRQLAIVVINGSTKVLPPPLASLFSQAKTVVALNEDGSELLALQDGYLPLYAARSTTDTTVTLGLGFTPEAARRALRDAPE